MQVNHIWWCKFLYFWEVMFGWYFNKRPYGHFGGQCQRCKRYMRKDINYNEGA
jgi:hypothetical protein